jgi:hypothetical protein
MYVITNSICDAKCDADTQFVLCHSTLAIDCAPQKMLLPAVLYHVFNQSDDASKLGTDYVLYVIGPFFLHLLNTPVQLHELQDVKPEINGYCE